MTTATAPRPAPALPEETAQAPPAEESRALRLAAFVALASWAAVHWAGLVADAPAGRAMLEVAVVSAGAAALVWLPRLPFRPAAIRAIGAAVVIAMLLAALLAAGLELRLLLPGGWAELREGVDRGLAGIQSVDWPYSGPDPWLRLTILLGAPPLLAYAAAVSFWPSGQNEGLRRAFALVAMLLLYGTAVTEHDPGAPLVRGIVLLALIAAWLWLPRLGPREAARGAVLVAAVGACALPFAARLDADEPWWDYRSWGWFGGGAQVSFDWDHAYGPLDWPRKGTTLLHVKSDRAHYWKTETLDRFDGFRWLRSGENSRTSPYGELPQRLEPEGRRWSYFEFNPRWDERIRFTVRGLRSDLVVGAGTTYSVRGAGVTAGTVDGTTTKLDEPLEEGQSYTVRAYAPDPSATQMRAAPRDYPAILTRYTSIFLPRPGATALDEGTRSDAVRSARPPGKPVTVGLRGDSASADPAGTRAIESSPYRRVYGLARRLTAGAPTAYEAVKRVERHLQRTYDYNEQPPSQEFPLAAFLFEDRIGYCQQFSGAMALMLRMAGIPARVAAGFSPGSYNRESEEYRVRDLDAHSWVEVYFTGIGWVPFDPTPAAAPAESQSTGAGSISAGGGENRDPGTADAVRGDTGADRGQAAGEGSGGQLGWWAVPLAGLLAALAAVATWLGLRARRSHAPGERADAQLRELERALRALGWRVPAGTTLLALERRLARVAGPRAAAYAARLRAHRYDPRRPAAPGPAERRALRRELVTGQGIRARLRALIALPPL
jgi:protein-glutamine gamma-glutamyltransferase